MRPTPSCPPPLLLASTSPQRRTLLLRLGVPFEALAPAYEERPDADLTPRDLAMTHARGKATSLAEVHPGHLIIGSDQVVVCEGKVMGKPGTPERALEQLSHMAGRCTQLITAVHLLHPAEGRSAEYWDEHRLFVRDLPAERLARYIDRDQPLGCAGSFKLEAQGIALFERIEGGDYTGIIGLPLMQLSSLLEDFGWEVP